MSSYEQAYQLSSDTVKNLRSHFRSKAELVEDKSAWQQRSRMSKKQLAAMGEQEKTYSLRIKKGKFSALLNSTDDGMSRTATQSLRDGEYAMIDMEAGFEGASALFDAMDRDGDGLLDFAELLTAYKILCADTDLEAQFLFVFRMFDTDHSGSVEQTEVEVMSKDIVALFSASDKAKSTEERKTEVQKLVSALLAGDTEGVMKEEREDYAAAVKAKEEADEMVKTAENDKMEEAQDMAVVAEARLTAATSAVAAQRPACTDAEKEDTASHQALETEVEELVKQIKAASDSKTLPALVDKKKEAQEKLLALEKKMAEAWLAYGLTEGKDGKLSEDEFVKAAMENEFLKNTLETGLLPMAKTKMNALAATYNKDGALPATPERGMCADCVVQ